jgi:peptide/nickel transport system substrate-binding protein
MEAAMMRRIALAAALVASFALILPTVPARGAATLRVGLFATPNTLNPLLASLNIEQYLYSAIFSGLTAIDDRGHIQPDLAIEVPTRKNGGISADGKTVTYHLRPGVKWQDGAPLTSADVAFTFVKMMDPNVAFPARSRFDPVASVSNPNPLTVVFRLKEPWPDAVATLFVSGQNGAVLPKHVLSSAGDMQHAAFNGMPIGSGPYRVDRWERGSLLRLRAFPGYFRGAPAIDTLDLKFIPDANTLTLAAKTGEVDLLYEAPPASLPMLDGVTRVRVVRVPTDSIAWLMMNLTAFPTSTSGVVEALSLAIDRTAMARNVYRGLAIPADDLVPPWSPYTTRNPNVSAYNLQAANAILDNIGWKRGPDGVRVRGDTPLELTLTTSSGNPQRAAMAVMLQSAWSKLGIRVNVKSLPINALVAPDGVLPRGDFQVAMLGFFFAPPADRSNLLLSTAIAPHGFNYPRFRNADVDKLILKAQQTDDGPARAKLYHEIAVAVANQRPFVPLLWLTDAYVVSTQLENLKPGPDAALFWNVWEWKLR